MAQPARTDRFDPRRDRRDPASLDRRVSRFPDRRGLLTPEKREGPHKVTGKDARKGGPEGWKGEAERGREAGRPGEIPKPGWRDIALRTWREQSKDNLSLVAAGVAFYVLLAMVPAMAAMLSIYGLVADPRQLQQNIGQMGGVLPQDAMSIIQRQLSEVASGAGGALSIAAAISILLALWSASKGMKGLIQALNIAYEEEEHRGFLKLNAVSLGLTLAGLIFFIVALTAVVAIPAILGNLGLPESVEWVVSLARWPLLALAGIAALAVLYRYAPSRDAPRWRWVSPGSVAATLLWIAASLLFSVYVSNFGSYNETYGSLGAVVILLMWLFITSYVVLLGAELNSEMEHQTRKDTTKGEPRPMGSRGARMADEVGEKP